MPVVSFKCPNCDGELMFDPASQLYKCEYCVSTFTQKEIDEQQDVVSASLSGTAAETAMTYSCPSCGAEIVTDATTAATFCYYCHNPVVLGGRVSGEFLPHKILPFKITKKAAVDGFLSHVNKMKYIPKDFFNKDQIEKMSGVYFPYWAYTSVVEGAVSAEGRTVNTWTSGDTQYTKTKYYDVKRGGNVFLPNNLGNALHKANAELANAVMPYDYRDLKVFNMGYLSGFFAEKRDIENDILKADMQKQALAASKNLLLGSGKQYNSTNVTESRINIKQEKWEYCLLPVWTITYKGNDGKIYYFSMNGQNGEVCGDFPIDKKKLVMHSFMVSAFTMIAGIIIALGGFLV